MTTHKVKFLPHETEITVPDGETIIHAAMEGSVHINASCGGEGVCGKCRVRIEEGTVDGGTTEYFVRSSPTTLDKKSKSLALAAVSLDRNSYSSALSSDSDE